MALLMNPPVAGKSCLKSYVSGCSDIGTYKHGHEYIHIYMISTQMNIWAFTQ